MALEDEFGLQQPRPRQVREQPTRREVGGSAVASIFAFGLGIAYLIGGRNRFSGNGYQVAREIAPWWFWGVLFIVYGLVVALTMTVLWHWAVLFLGAFPYIVFCIASFVSALEHSENVSFAGTWIFAWFAGLHLFLARRRVKLSIERTSTL